MKTHLSEEILDILNESPRAIVRLGISVILFLFMLFVSGTWFIRYPEVLKGSVLVTTAAPTVKIAADHNGQLMRLLVSNGAKVKKGDVVAEMENRTKLENTPLLHTLLSQAKGFLQRPQTAMTLPDASLTWGDLQNDVHTLCQNYLDFKQFQNDGFQAAQVSNLRSQMDALRALQNVYQRKKELGAEAFKNASTTHAADKKLYEEGVYSRSEYFQKENNFLKIKREQEELAETLIQNSLKLAELEQALQKLQHGYGEKQRLALLNITQAVQNIENGLNKWQQQYLITAPSDGTLTYLQTLTENQFVVSGEALFSVKPERQEFMAMVDIPVKGMGKACVGQKVVLKLDDFPYQEFGTVEGRVYSMAPSKDVKTYRVEVSLPYGLQSTYRKTFPCPSELTGTAEIITEDMRLVERAFYGIRRLVM